MDYLKEKFERRIVVPLACLLTLLAAVMLAISVGGMAKADPNGPDGDEGNVFDVSQFALTRIVAGPDDLTASGSFVYTFEKYSYNGHPVTSQDDPNMPYIGDNNGTVTLPLNIESGEIKSVAGDGIEYFKADGPGTINAEETDIDDQDASHLDYKHSDDPASRGYIVQKRMSSFTHKGDDFATAGVYAYRVIESSCTNYDEDDRSLAEYWIYFYVEADASNAFNITGMILMQEYTDDYIHIRVDKKDPRLHYGRSFAQGTTEVIDSNVTVPYYRGFTFTSHRLSKEETFYIQKIVKGQTLGEDMVFTIDLIFRNEVWNIGDVFYGIVVDKNGTSIKAVEFTVRNITLEGGVNIIGAENSFQLGDQQKIVFDGVTKYTDTSTSTTYISSKIVTGTVYGYTEALPQYDASQVTPEADTYTATSSTPVHSAVSAELLKHVGYPYLVAMHNSLLELFPEYKELIEPVSTAIISSPPAGQSYENKGIITNTVNMTPTGIWVDSIPYVLLIGVPLLALIIWIVARKRKYSARRK